MGVRIKRYSGQFSQHTEFKDDARYAEPLYMVGNDMAIKPLSSIRINTLQNVGVPVAILTEDAMRQLRCVCSIVNLM